LRDLDRDECEEVKGKRVVVDDVVSDDLGEVVASFKEKGEMVLAAKVEDAMVGDKRCYCLEYGERKWITVMIRV